MKSNFFYFLINHFFIIFKRLLIYVCYCIDIAFCLKQYICFFFIKLDNIKFAVTSVSIRVLAQILFTYTYNNKDVAKYSVTARMCF